MDTIQIKDKMFTVSIKEQDILKEVTRVANEINRDLAGNVYFRPDEAHHHSL